MTILRISGMTCGNCARHVTEAIQSVPGVRSAGVSLQNARAVINWDAGAAENLPAIFDAVKAAGYEAKPAATDSAGRPESAPNDWRLGLWLGIVVTIFLMAGEWLFSWGLAGWFAWVSFVLAGLVQGISGAPFYRGAWRQLKMGSSNMDTLVALGSTTAFGYSAWALLSGAGGHLYFMESAAIITLISCGHWLEARVFETAGQSLKSLLQLAPPTARKIQRPKMKPFDLRITSFSERSKPVAQTEIEVPVSTLQTGDEIILRPGDSVPVDGIVIEGESAVDESSLTGEPFPVEKKSGSELFAGTANANGRLVMRVTAIGEATALAHIIAAVQRAQASRANIQRLGDLVSSAFVPVIVVVAVAAGLWWGLAPASAVQLHQWLARFLWPAHTPAGGAAGFIIAAAVLIIACPCAMGLATPAAIMAGANTAARRGILVRDAVALEKAGTITAIVFDKTGTLTFGKPEVAEILAFYGERSAVEKLAASLAGNSAHPISRAIAKISSARVELSGWHEIRGCGSAAENGDLTMFRLGSLRWLGDEGVELAPGEKFISDWSNQGATIVGLSVDKKLHGLIALRDSVKPDAAAVVKNLTRKGLKTYLVTGDNSQTAAGIARQVGLAPENVFAEVRPEQKSEFVKKLQSQGERVAFVGDGINDAPALTQADLGIAVSRASDIAREAADIILLKSEIAGVPEALGLAQATLRTIKQNLFWAFFYNAVGVPLAAFGFISPVFCAAAMGLSDLIVIGNALRLLRWRRSNS
ncbi:MAG: heavy metal translocating P-type ATPase [Limisphaerales bacterium]